MFLAEHLKICSPLATGGAGCGAHLARGWVARLQGIPKIEAPRIIQNQVDPFSLETHGDWGYPHVRNQFVKNTGDLSLGICREFHIFWPFTLHQALPSAWAVPLQEAL